MQEHVVPLLTYLIVAGIFLLVPYSTYRSWRGEIGPVVARKAALAGFVPLVIVVPVISVLLFADLKPPIPQAVATLLLSVVMLTSLLVDRRKNTSNSDRGQEVLKLKMPSGQRSPFAGTRLEGKSYLLFIGLGLLLFILPALTLVQDGFEKAVPDLARGLFFIMIGLVFRKQSSSVRQITDVGLQFGSTLIRWDNVEAYKPVYECIWFKLCQPRWLRQQYARIPIARDQRDDVKELLERYLPDLGDAFRE